MTDSITLIIYHPNPKARSRLIACCRQQSPDINCLDWVEAEKQQQLNLADAALVWEPPAGFAQKLPARCLIQNYGAGVDAVVNAGPLQPQQVLCRYLSAQLNQDMARYLVGQIVNDQLSLQQCRAQQQQKEWREPKPTHRNKIGLMGLGEIGGFVAGVLQQLGYEVSGWKRTANAVPDSIELYTGLEGLHAMARQADYLVNLLPLTERTHDLINFELLAHCNPDCCLINVGRGASLVDDDLIKALDQNKIRKAILDVFRQEPLPAEHPFWIHSAIDLTPHIASPTDHVQVIRHTLENLHRWRHGESLLGQVDLEQGY